VEVRHLRKTSLEELLGSKGRAATGMANHHHGAITGDLRNTSFQLWERD
jgi:hypothetical protein